MDLPFTLNTSKGYNSEGSLRKIAQSTCAIFHIFLQKASIVKVRSKYNGYDKPVTTIFVGTSPELEMALYTVCFYARPDGNCPVSLGGTKFDIVTHKFKYRGNDLVGTAYPEI